MQIKQRLPRLRRNQQVSNRDTLLNLRRLFIAVTFALAPAILDAQEIAIGTDEGKPLEERIIYNHETTAHVTLHTQGLGAGFKISRIRTIKKTTDWDFELSYLRSLKQIKVANTFYYFATPFVYGKLYDVLVARGGRGETRRLYGKPYWGGVELRWLYEFGGSVAFLKPYYYKVSVITPSATGGYTQVEEYRTFDEQLEIIGKAPFTIGLNEIRLRPGIHAKGGLSFDFAASRTRVSAIEVGAMAEYFPQGIQIMADNPADHIFLTLYIAYHWGSRFNKY